MDGRRHFLRSVCAGSGILLAGCVDSFGDGNGSTPVTTMADGGEMAIRTDAFEDGGQIPPRYTFDGSDVSPPLSITGVPADAASLVLIVDDPDAPNPPFTHWLLWDLSPDTETIPENIPQSRSVGALDGARQGTNSFGELGYRGPRPPEGDGPHTYRFTLYAVASPLNVQAGARRGRVDDGLTENLVGTARLTGEYDR